MAVSRDLPDFIRKGKRWLLIALVVLALLFAFQNQFAVTVRFLFWSIEMSRFALIALTFSAGIVSGWLIQSLWFETRDKTRRPAPGNPSGPE